jgi:hypothetical protein
MILENTLPSAKYSIDEGMVKLPGRMSGEQAITPARPCGYLWEYNKDRPPPIDWPIMK